MARGCRPLAYRTYQHNLACFSPASDHSSPYQSPTYVVLDSSAVLSGASSALQPMHGRTYGLLLRHVRNRVTTAARLCLLTAFSCSSWNSPVPTRPIFKSITICACGRVPEHFTKPQWRPILRKLPDSLEGNDRSKKIREVGVV